MCKAQALQCASEVTMLSFSCRCQGRAALEALPPEMKMCHWCGSEGIWGIGYGATFTAGKEGVGTTAENEFYYTLFSACYSYPVLSQQPVLLEQCPPL